MKRLWNRLRAVFFWVGPFTLPAAAVWYLTSITTTCRSAFRSTGCKNGRADQWAEKSVQGVFYGPVIGGLVMVFAALAELLILAADRTAPVELIPKRDPSASGAWAG